MLGSLPAVQRFLHSHYFFSGIRQAVGVLLPALFIALMLGDAHAAMVTAIGASCVAIMDQSGRPRQYTTRTMLGAIVLGTCTVLIAGLATTQHLLPWLIIPLLVFSLSMLSVYGKHGGLMAFACLLVMTLTLRAPLELHSLLFHTLQSLAGGVFYFCYSYVVHRLFWHRETQQALSAALFATADYVRARSRLYNPDSDLDDHYRKLIRSQATMTEAHQLARDAVLRDLPTGARLHDRTRLATLNIFTDMVDLLDTMVATHTDYATLHRTLPDHDMLVFARDALVKLADNLHHIALCVSRNQRARERYSVKAELRAFEYDLEILKREGLNTDNPEVYALLVQVLRRLRNAARIVGHMTTHSQGKSIAALQDTRMHREYKRFLSQTPLRLGMLTSNLRIDSPHFRYAVRIALAAMLGLLVAWLAHYLLPLLPLGDQLEVHGYWVILTIIVIMRPGFALTRQRNNLRLMGTGIGCLLAWGLLYLTQDPALLFTALFVSLVLGYSLVVTHFLGAAIFNTLTVLLAFQLMLPTSQFIIGERLIDTVLGCAVAWLGSYILPWWEANFMASLASALRRNNQRFFHAGLRYAKAERALQAEPDDSDARLALLAERNEADLAWRLAHKNVGVAFGNFASAFYRMVDEPVRQQQTMPVLNHLMLQNHVLTMQINAATPLLASLEEVPPGIQLALNTIDNLLAGHDGDTNIPLETEGNLAALAYPLRQMLKAAQLIRHEMRSLTPALPAGAAAGRGKQVAA